MAKDVITRFKLETTQYDSKLREAAKELTNFTKTATQAGKQFDGFTKAQLEAARAFGQVASGATNTKERLKDTVSAFNSVAKAYESLTATQKQSDFGKAMASSLEQLQQRIRETKSELYSLDSATKDIGKNGGGLGGLFGGDKLSGMMQVLGGNLMTKGVAMAANFVGELGSMVQQSVKLAQEAEGIRIAFERLNRPDLLDKLKEATHGTVSELNLMRQAVKFNDFRLNLDEMGALLAFAQQKAKDTGQSVDDMVDSIVNGLGRQSLMVLDNLGLSAAEIKEKMAETGDMTKAVGEIVREQMSKAGDYVETAADRSGRATADVEDAMVRLGKTFEPLSKSGVSMFNDLKKAALNLLNDAIKPLIQYWTEPGRIQKFKDQIGGDELVDKFIENLSRTGESNRNGLYNRQLMRFNQRINETEANIQKELNRYGHSFKWRDLTEIKQAYIEQRNDYMRRAVPLLQPKVDTSSAVKSIDDLKAKLIELERQRKKAIKAGDRDQIKHLTQQINQTKQDIKGLDPKALTTTTTHKVTPQERAQSKVDAALQDYAATIKKADLRMEAGLDSTLDHKKKELSAQERLYDAYTDAYVIYKNPAYKEASEKAASEIKRLAGEVKDAADAQEATKKAARELESAQKKLADAQAKLADAQATGSATAIYKAQENVRKQEAVVDRLKNPNAPAQSQPTGFAALSQSIQGELKFDQMKVDETTLRTLLSTAIKNGLDEVTVDYNRIQEKIAQGIDIPESTWKELQDEINAKLAELGIEPIKLNFETGSVSKEGKAVTDSWKSAAQAVQSVGQAMQQIEDPVAKVAGIVGQAIATIALTFAQSLKGTVTPWDWIAAAAAGTATMVSTIAAIKSATSTQKFANGGIVQGNTYSGDQIDIKANAGEVVLTRAQAGNLAEQLSGGGLGNMQLEARVSAEDLIFVLNSNGRRRGIGKLIKG